MTVQNPEPVDPDDSERESEEVDEKIVDIYEDVPQFDEAPWANAVIDGVQDDEAVEE